MLKDYKPEQQLFSHLKSSYDEYQAGKNSHYKDFSSLILKAKGSFENYYKKRAVNLLPVLESLKTQKCDAIFLTSPFMGLHSHNREEDASNKLAWFLTLGHLSSEERVQYINIFFQKMKELVGPGLTNVQELTLTSEYAIHREYHLNGQYLDLLIEDDAQNACIGIEIKINDENYLKSNNDLNSVKKFKKHLFYLILPAEKIPKIKATPGIEFSYISWENICHIIREINNNDSFKMNPLHQQLSEMFLGSIEMSVLGFDLPGIMEILSRNMNDLNIRETYLVEIYLKHRGFIK